MTTADRVTRARALMDLGRHDQARGLLAEALAEVPGDAQAWSAMARCCYRTDDFEAALHSADQALAHNPALAAAWRWRALSLAELKRWQEAHRAASEAVSREPLNWSGHMIMARGLLADPGRGGDDRRARGAAHRARELAPHEAETHFYAGRVAERAGHQDEAEACYREALRLNPEQRSARNQLALIQMRRGENYAAAQGFAAVAASAKGAELGIHNLKVVAVRLISKARWISVAALVVAEVGVIAVPDGGWVVRGVLMAVLLAGWAVWAVWAARQVPPQLRGPLLRTVRGSAYVLLVLLGVAAFSLAAFALLLVPVLSSYWGEMVFAAVAVQLTALRTAAVLVQRAKRRVE